MWCRCAVSSRVIDIDSLDGTAKGDGDTGEFDVPSSSRLSTCPACCDSALSGGDTVDARLDMDRIKWEYERGKRKCDSQHGSDDR